MSDDLDKIIEDSAPIDETERLRRRLADEQRAHAATRRATSKAEARIVELEALMDRYQAVKPADMKVPKWLAPKARPKAHRATALLMLSDLHLDEVVDRHEMSGMNEFNRAIAERRLEHVVEGTVKLTSTYVAGVTFDGIVVALNGDILSGEIHDELARTNAAPTTASVTHWVPRLASALTYLADHYGRVHDRITFTITTAPGVVYPIYDTVFHQSHGDAFRSAGGVGGLYPSMLKHILRLDAMWGTQGHRIDCHLFGHWHQYLTGSNFLVNGSLVGYNEYARRSAFGFEPPRQALAIVTPERGIVQQMPVYAE